jgi:hypothetical protein
MGTRRLALTLALAGAVGGWGARAPAQEIDLAYSYLTGSFGTAAEGEVQQLRLGLEWGSRVRFHAVVSAVSGRVPKTLVRTRLGEASLERLRRAGVRPPPPEETVETRTESGLGDVRLGAAVPLAGGGARRHRLEAEVDLKAPTADEEHNLGTGEWDARFGLFGEYRFWSATLFAGAGYNLLGDPKGLELDDVPDALVGVESEPLPSGIRLAAWVEGYPEVLEGAGARIAFAAGVGGAGRYPWRLVARAGLTEASEDFAVEAGYSLRPTALRRRRP